jgi:hypothetical protein
MLTADRRLIMSSSTLLLIGASIAVLIVLSVAT